MNNHQSNNQSEFKISVVIITCERPDYLAKSLKSALEQTFEATEVIIIDDCSKADYSQAFVPFQDDAYIYYRLNERSGANAARNKGVELSKGNVIAFLDDDDIWDNSFLERHYKQYLDGAEAVVCGYKILGSAAEVHVNHAPRVTEDELRKGNTFAGMSGFSAIRKLLVEIPFDINLKNGQDWDLFVRMSQQKVKFINISLPLFQYRRVSPDGITAKAKTMNVSDADLRLASAYKHREWLGELNFKQRVADQLLSFIVHKRNKIAWLLESIKRAGFVSTLIALRKKLKRRL